MAANSLQSVINSGVISLYPKRYSFTCCQMKTRTLSITEESAQVTSFPLMSLLSCLSSPAWSDAWEMLRIKKKKKSKINGNKMFIYIYCAVFCFFSASHAMSVTLLRWNVKLKCILTPVLSSILDVFTFCKCHLKTDPIRVCCTWPWTSTTIESTLWHLLFIDTASRDTAKIFDLTCLEWMEAVSVWMFLNYLS